MYYTLKYNICSEKIHFKAIHADHKKVSVHVVNAVLIN